MSINLIVARDANRGIGKDGKLPWKDEAEMKHFRETTKGKIVVMGYNTFKHDLKEKPLPGRENIVLCRNGGTLTIDFPQDNDATPTTLRYCTHEAFQDELFGLTQESDVFIIGGSKTYEQYLPYCDFAYVSEGNFDAGCDTFFNEGFDEKEWRIVEEKPLSDAFTLRVYEHVIPW